MKKQLSSIDLHYLVKELQALKDSRIDKIYQPEKELIVFSLYKTNAGKRLLRIDIGKSIFIAEEKESYEEILGFGQFLRKHIDGYFLTEMEQINPERIIKLTFRANEEKKFLYEEIIGFGQFLRKHIDGYFLTEMEQINPERIIKLTFRANEEKKFLYAEF